jgi:hypothetical protein
MKWNDAMDIGAAEGSKHVKNIFVINTRFLQSGVVWVMHVHSITCLMGHLLHRYFRNYSYLLLPDKFTSKKICDNFMGVQP